MSSVSMMPGGPLDLPSTQTLLRQRMEQGDITQEDVNILKRGYRWMIVSAMVGAAAGIPFYMSMGRRKPPISTGRKVIATWFVASTGSFLGFTIGGAAAALEVNTNMQDSQRKMRVFEEIMVESKRLAEETRAGRIPPPDRFPSSTTYDNSPGTSAASGSRMSEDLQGVSMSGFENEGRVFAGENPDGAERRRELEREGGVGSGGIRQATESTWDRIRSGETPMPSSPSKPSDPSTRPSSSPFASSSRANAPMSDSRASPSSREQFGRPTNLSTRDLDIKVDSLGGAKGDLGSTGEIMGLGGAVEERDREREQEKREFQMLMDRERNIGGKEEGFETGRWK